jgi:hypothetical protein
MPVDLSKKLRTLPIEEFAKRYPTPKIKYDPRLETLRVETEPEETPTFELVND